jgi:threonine dehydratase
VDQNYLQRILTSRVYDVASETPLHAAPRLSARLHSRVFLKREDLQPIFSFKIRGAYNKMAHLTAEERERGVITASAGNHAQGVAFAAQRLNLRSVIVMPATTPSIKVRAVRERGAEIVLHGDSYSDAEARAYEIQATEGLTFVHPYDDPHVIAGQGTIGLELSRQMTARPFTVFVPIGGGGLIAGIAMVRSVRMGERITLSQVGIFVDGVAVRRVGVHTFVLARRYVDDYIQVSTDDVCAAIKDVFEDTRAVMEPAGALAVAGMKAYVERRGERNADLVALTCGANLNFDRLKHIAERAEIGERREALLAVTIPERPGAFKAFCRAVGNRSITEFNYRFAPRDDAVVYVGIQLDNANQRASLINSLRGHGYPVLDLTQNELAVVHLRHLVGGRAPEIADERLLSFEFPERPGALLQFLEALDETWNISLFHYRNHGSANGRVLAGIQVPAEDLLRFGVSLSQLGYYYVDETENPGYRAFLK